MNQNQLVKDYLIGNERELNTLLSKIMPFFTALCFLVVIFNEIGMTSYSTATVIKLCLFYTVCAWIPYFVCKHCYNEKWNVTICLVCLEAILAVFASNAFTYIDMLLLIVPIVSILYLDRQLYLTWAKNCFGIMICAKAFQFLQNKQIGRFRVEGVYKEFYESALILVLEYMILVVMLYVIMLRLSEMVASGYRLEKREDGTITRVVVAEQEKVMEAYNTKGLFLEIEQTLQSMIRGKDKQFEVDVDFDLPVQLCGDKQKVKLALINLLSDFLQFTEHGNVKLEVSFDKRILPKKGQNITVICRILCSQDLSEDLKYGNAMGFALAKNMLQKLGAVILDRTGGNAERTTCYTISLLQMVEDEETLLHTKQVRQSEQKELISESRKRAQDILLAKEVKVLLVDDSPVNLKLVDAILKAYGMMTTCVTSGDQAIEEIQKKKYDLVIIDHMMPIKNGIQTAKEIRLLDDSYFEVVPLMAMSSNLTEDAMQIFKDAGFVSVISKPIKEAELRQAISQCMFLSV